jgi:hypothetical protein
VTDRWLLGDTRERLREMAAGSVHTCVTSPPYWGLRAYLPDDHPDKPSEIGGERTFEEYVATMVDVFREVRRVIRDDGTLWLNLGDCYATGAGKVGEHPGGGEQGARWKGETARAAERSGHEGKHAYRVGPLTQANRLPQPGLKPKDLVGIPWRVAFALQADGWYLRAACPWIKRACMPSSVQDRPTTGVEQVFLFAKDERYFYDLDAVRVTPTSKPQRRLTRREENAKGAVAAPGGKVRPPNYDVMTEPGVNNTPIGGRNRRDTDWFFESLGDILDGGEGLLHSDEGDPLAFVVNTQPFGGAHFATMPPGLAEPCVLAGTSAHGCCAACGAPWERVTERAERPGVGAEDVPINGRDGLTAQPGLERTGMSHFRYAEWLRENPPIARGWEPSCACGAEVTPCVVLDPFGGAGTTALVARRTGRRFVHIELNPAYMEIARRRVEGEAFQPSLFAGAGGAA